MSDGRVWYRVWAEVVNSTHDCHEIGQRFEYPQDFFRICKWMRPSFTTIAETFAHGGNFDHLLRNGLDPNTTVPMTCLDKAQVVFVIKREKLTDPIMDPFE